MAYKVSNKICSGIESKNSIIIGAIKVIIKFLIECDTVHIVLTLTDNKKHTYSFIKLSTGIRNNIFCKTKIVKNDGLPITLNDKSKYDLDLSFALNINKYQYNISILTDRIRKYKMEIIINDEQPLPKLSHYFVSYINTIKNWWPPALIAGDLGVPGYSHPYSYNIINLTFWTTNQGPVDTALLWSQALTYVSADNPWGSTTDAIQKAWISLYHANGIRVCISAFGATDNPTSQGTDPVTIANQLAAFVLNNNLDGVDLDWEDNAALENGTGESWLVACTQRLRELLPTPYIISHAPQAPYFMGTIKYKNGGYITVNQHAGNDIDFYNVQFYNQDSSSYSTYETLFNVSTGWATNTAVKQIATTVSREKIVVGKPVLASDAFNTGYVEVNQLAQFLKSGATDGYSAGFMGWQFSSDADGSWSRTLAASFV